MFEEIREAGNLGRFLICPNRKIYGLYIEADFKAETIIEIIEVIKKRGVLIPSVRYCLSSDEGIIGGLVYVDLTDVSPSVEELAEEIRKIAGVRNLKIVRPTAEGFVVDSSIPILNSERVILLRMPGYVAFIKELRNRFGSAAEAFLYYEGYHAGIEYGKSHRKIAEKLGIKDPLEIAYKITAPLCAGVGFGKMEIVRTSSTPPQAILRVYDNFECEVGIGFGEPYSQWLRGAIEGVFSVLFGLGIRAEETKCIAKGDPYCEFALIVTGEPVNEEVY